MWGIIFGPSWSTETHLAHSFEANGHEVLRIQEREGGWRDVPDQAQGSDLVLWTRTYGLDRDLDAQRDGLAQLSVMGIPSAAWHLDKFFDLPRADQLTTEPWFTCDHVVTADGGNQERFGALGINHHWLPPGVFEPECMLGRRDRRYMSEVAFVGNWRDYHPEWAHRRELVSWLKSNVRPTRMAFWPQQQQIRGAALSNLYASVKIAVGDSCMVGGTGRYWSDRIPETLGRGGFLLHPWTEGLEEHFTPGKHLVCWPLGDWEELRRMIDYYLTQDAERESIRRAGYEHVLAHHTYTVRVREFLALIDA